jgi:HEAT repeats
VPSRLPILRTFIHELRGQLNPKVLRVQLEARAGRFLNRARALARDAGKEAAPARELIERVRESSLPIEVERVGSQVQRLGQRAFTRMLKRWPGLSELVNEPGKVVRRGRAPARKPSDVGQLAEFEGDDTAADVLVVQLVAAPTWQSRASAAEALARVQGEGIAEALTHALRDASAEVAIAAVDALAQRGEPAAVGALRAVVDNVDGFFSPVTRVAALSALGRMLCDSELAPIVGCVRDVDAEVSIAAIAVVADRQRETALEHLLPILEDRTGYFLPVVRLAAANALTRSGALTPELSSQLLESEAAQSVRRVLERAAQCPPMNGLTPAGN